MKKSRYGKLSILIILIATLFISAAIALFGLSTNDLTGANSSAEITAPEKDASSSIVDGTTGDDGTIENPEVEATPTASYTGIANWSTAVATSGNTLTLTTCTLTSNLWVSSGITLNLVINPGQTVTMSNYKIIVDGTGVLNVSGTGTVKPGTVAAFQMQNGGKLNMTGITINGGTNGFGTAFEIFEGSSASMTGGTIKGGVSTNYGAVYLQNGSFTMSGGTICENKGGWGGGVAVNGGTFTMSGGTIDVNTATNRGGGVYIQSNDSSGAAGTFTMQGENARITNNTSSSGGGVYIGVGGTFTMSKGLIDENSATSTGYTNVGGGGVYISNSCRFTMSGGTISNNSAYNGGGVHDDGGTFEFKGGSINGNTSTSDSTNTGGGGVYIMSSGKMTMASGTITGNRAVRGGGVMLVHSGSSLTISSGQIGSSSSGNIASQRGGGVYVHDSASFTLSGGYVSYNTATNSYGGGIYCGTSATVTISGSSPYVSYNKTSTTSTSGWGGGICVDGGTVNFSSGNITANNSYYGGGVFVNSGTFSQSGGYIGSTSSTGTANTSTSNGGGVYVNPGATFNKTSGYIQYNTSNGHGGGIFSYGGKVNITTNTANYIVHNTAKGNGGGVALASSSTGTFSVGSISNNTASGSGGGVYVGDTSTFAMSSGTISSNKATGTSSDGGGIHSSGSSVTITGGSISSNTAYRNGGGIRIIAGSLAVSGTSSTKSNIHNNTAISGDGYGGGISVHAATSFTLGAYTEVYNNTGNYGGGIHSNVALTINNSTTKIYTNTANRNGGGIYKTGSDALTISAGYIYSNKTTTSTSYGLGGGICSTTAVTMSGGYIHSNTCVYGGGVYMSSGTLTMSGGYIGRESSTSTTTGNSASRNGGGVYVQANATFTKTGGYIEYNKALGTESTTYGYGGGVACIGTFNMTTNAANYIRYNTAYAAGGVAIYGTSKTFTFSAGTIGNNTATGMGGGVVISGSHTFSMNSGNAVISGNTASTGGGVYIASSSTFNFTAGYIRANSAVNGGGVYYNAGTFTFNGGTIGTSGNANTASSYGGGVYLNASWTPTKGTIAYNTSTGSNMGGGGVYVNTGTFTLNNNNVIINNNAATAGYGGGVLVAGSSTFAMSAGYIRTNSAAYGAGVSISGSAKITLSGGTIGGSSTYKNTATWYGGGIFIQSSATSTMTGGTISYNGANSGGGVCLFSGSLSHTSAGTIANNTAANGGGVYIHTGTYTLNGSTAYVQYNSATSTTSTTVTFGGGVYIAGGTFNFSNGYIRNNTATNTGSTTSATHGGGVYMADGTFTMSGGFIRSNSARQDGGGIYANGASTLTIRGGVIGGSGYANTAAVGGGVYINTSTAVTFSAGTISYNTASNAGGGISIYAGTRTLNMSSTAIVANNTANNGGGIYVNGAGSTVTTLNLSGGQIYSNTATSNGGGIYGSGANSKIVMTGGTIGGPSSTYANKATIGGGVYNNGTFTMSAGVVAYNTASSTTSGGGGVVTAGTFTMSGSAEIRYNSASAGGGVYLQGETGIFNFQGGKIYNNSATTYVGGGIHSFKGTINMSGGEIYSNTATTNGGGISINYSSTLNLTGGKIYNNTATYGGGGIYAEKNGADSPTIIIDDGEIYSNTATGYGGGGIYVYGASLTLNDGLIYSNTAVNSSGGGIYAEEGSFIMNGGVIGGDDATFANKAAIGGGIYTCYTDVDPIVITGGTIKYNSAWTGGGIGATDGGQVVISGGEIINNTATGSVSPKYDGNGGGVYIDVNAELVMTGGVIRDNTAATYGGGVYVNFSSFTLTDGEITDNVALTPYGAGVYVGTASQLELGSTAYVYGNTYRDTENNVFVLEQVSITFTSKLAEGAKIGIIAVDDFVLTSGFTTAGHTESDIEKYFVSDIKGLVFSYIDDEIVVTYDIVFAWNQTVKASLDNNSTELFVLYKDWTVKNSSFGTGIGFTNDGTILVPTDSSVIFDFNGFTVDRDGTAGSVMRVEGTIVLDACEGKNGYITGGNAENGGGIYVYGGSLTLKNAVICDNIASYGGGVNVDGGGIFVMEGGSIVRNEAENGGAVYVKDGEFNLVDGVIGGKEKDKNTAKTYGGGIYVASGGFAVVSGGEVSYNEALSGAGVAVFGGRFTLEDGAINNNAATEYGGGLYVDGGLVDLTGGVIGGESATFANTAENGGGVYLASGTVTVDGSVISANTATQNGGGAYMNGGTLKLSDGYVRSNSAYRGGGVYVNGGTFTMTDGTISGNTSTASSPSSNFGGGGVYVSNGKFEMSGGVIGGTSAADANSAPQGGGVYVNGGTVEMSGGKIIGNTTSYSLGGVLIYNGTFEMTGGEISNNKSTGVYNSSTFTMSGGTISGSTTGVYNGSGGTFTMSGGTISGSTTGVYNGSGGTFTMSDTAIVSGNTTGVNVFNGTFTMSGGTISGNNGEYGAGVYLRDGKATVSGTAKITNNTATYGGGVIVYGGTFTQLGGEISNNDANKGGGVYLSGGTFEMSGGTIAENTAVSGSGVYVANATFTMTDGTISGNTATENGGGVEVYGSAEFTMSGGEISDNTAIDGAGLYLGDGKVTVSDAAKIINNQATEYGGGVYVNNGASAEFTMSGGTIGENTARSGGGLYINASTVEMSGGTITENHATDATETAGGGGVFVYNGTLTVSGTAKITNNVSARYGGGLRIDGSTDTSTVEISDGAVSENKAAVGGGAYVTGNFATLTLNSSAMISENEASTSGGGVAIYDGATVEVSDNAFLTYNTAAANGGGVYVTGAGSTLNVSDKGALTHNSANYGGAVYVTASGAFTMADGSIAYNETTTSGGAVYVTGATFNLEDGEVLGNSAVEYGGAIYVAAGSSSIFTMSGGTIGGEDTFTNTSARGGGMYVAGGAVTLTSGSISGNTATVNGGGVYLNAGTFSVKGNPVISGNKLHDSDSNLYLYNGKTIQIIGKLTDGASIGLTGKDKITEGYTTNGNGETEKAYFFGDVLGTVVAIVNGEIYLQVSLEDAWNAAVQASLDHNGSAITFVLAEAWRAENGSFGEGVGFTDDGALYLPSGAYIVLNLNNYSIDRNLSTISGTGSVFYVKGTLEISGTTGIITGGKSEQGGGVHIEEGGLFKMEVAYIQQNEATQGGGVYVESGARFELAEGAIRGNSAEEGAGVYVEEGGTFNMTGGAIGGTGYANEATNGAGVYSNGTVKLSGGYIRNNTATENGGGAYVAGGEFIANGGYIGGTATTFANTAVNGAGVYVAGGEFTLDGATVAYNSATSGSGIYAYGGVIEINDGAISNNTSTSCGGVHVMGNAVFYMNGGEISSNTATDSHGGVYFGENSSGEINGGKISANKATNSGAGVGVASKLVMNGGEIIGNLGYLGSNVYVYGNGTFEMNGGTISGGNTSTGRGGGVATNGKFILNDGSITGNVATMGAGVYIGTNGTLEINGGEISGNTATQYGGGVYIAEDGAFTLSNGEISHNDAQVTGGGVYNLGTFEMDGGLISSNSSLSATHGGGGVYSKGTFTMTDGEISANKAENNIAGGVWVDSGSTFEMNGGSISGNTSRNSSGVYISGGTFTLNDGEISGNTTTVDGGGVSVAGSGIFTLNGGTISYNTAARGGAVCVFGGSTLNLTGGKITGNKATGLGGGIYVETNAKLNVSGSPIVSGNTANGVENNIYLVADQVITVSGMLAVNGMIAWLGVTMADPSKKKFTLGFAEKNTDYNPDLRPETVFFSDDTDYMVGLEDGEAVLKDNDYSQTSLMWQLSKDGGKTWVSIDSPYYSLRYKAGESYSIRALDSEFNTVAFTWATNGDGEDIDTSNFKGIGSYKFVINSEEYINPSLTFEVLPATLYWQYSTDEGRTWFDLTVNTLIYTGATYNIRACVYDDGYVPVKVFTETMKDVGDYEFTVDEDLYENPVLNFSITTRYIEVEWNFGDALGNATDGYYWNYDGLVHAPVAVLGGVSDELAGVDLSYGYAWSGGSSYAAAQSYAGTYALTVGLKTADKNIVLSNTTVQYKINGITLSLVWTDEDGNEGDEFTFEYDSEKHGVNFVLSGVITGDTVEPYVTYASRSGKELAEAPTAVGYYTATVKLPANCYNYVLDKTYTCQIVITQKTVAVEWIGNDDGTYAWTFNGQGKAPVASIINPITGEALNEAYTVEYAPVAENGNIGVYSKQQPVNAGNYIVRLTLTNNDGNFVLDETTTTQRFTINKLGVNVTWTGGKNFDYDQDKDVYFWYYDGEEHAIEAKVELSGDVYKDGVIISTLDIVRTDAQTALTNVGSATASVALANTAFNANFYIDGSASQVYEVRKAVITSVVWTDAFKNSYETGDTAEFDFGKVVGAEGPGFVAIANGTLELVVSYSKSYENEWVVDEQIGYTAYAKLSTADAVNYEFADGAEYASLTFFIKSVGGFKTPIDVTWVVFINEYEYVALEQYLTDGGFVYNGNVQSPTPIYLRENGDYEILALNANSIGADAGKYTARVKPSSVYEIKEEDFTCDYEIKKLDISINWQDGQYDSNTTFTYVYSGKAQAPYAYATGEGEFDFTTVNVTVEGNVNAGEYLAKAIVGDNFNIVDGATQKYTVSKLGIDAGKIVWDFIGAGASGDADNGWYWVYDGKEHSPAAKITLDFITLELLVTGKTSEIGVHTAYAVLNSSLAEHNNFYLTGTASATFEIVQVKIGQVYWEDDDGHIYEDGKGGNTGLVFTYNGDENGQAPKAYYLDENGDKVYLTVTVIGGTAVNAGNYSAYVDIESVPSCTFTINAKELDAEWSNLKVTFNGSEQKPEVTLTGAELTEGEDYVVTGYVKAGVYKVTIKFINANYTVAEENASCEFVIEKITLTEDDFEWSETGYDEEKDGYFWLYDGNAHAPTLTISYTIGEGDDAVEVIFEVGYTGVTSTVGTHTVTAYIKSAKIGELDVTDSFAFSADMEYVIVAQTVTIDWDFGDAEYDEEKDIYFWTYDGSKHAPKAYLAYIDENGEVQRFKDEDGNDIELTVYGAETNARDKAYTATAELSEEYVLADGASATQQYYINKATIEVNWDFGELEADENGVYTWTYGDDITPKAYIRNEDGENGAELTVTGFETDAGTHTLTLMQSDGNYEFASENDASKTYVIKPMTVYVIWYGVGGYEENDTENFEWDYVDYDTAIAPTAYLAYKDENGDLQLLLDKDGKAIPVEVSGGLAEVGEHTAQAVDTFVNYDFAEEFTQTYKVLAKDLADSDFKWTDENAQVSDDGLTFTYEYSGGEIMPTPTSNVKDLEFNVTITNAAGEPVSVITEVGTYKVTVTCRDENYTVPEDMKTVTVIVTAKKVAVEWDETPLVYNGENQQPKAYYTDVAGNKIELEVTVDGDSANAGTKYQATASLDTTNYELDEETKTYEFEIAQKEIEVKYNWEDVTYDRNKHAPKPEITVSASEKDGLTVVYEITKNGVKVAGDGEKVTEAGEYVIKVSLEGTAAGNYKLVNAEYKFNINKVALTVTAKDQTFDYGTDAPEYTTDFVTFDGLLAGEADEVKAALSAVISQWFRCAYVNTTVPGEYKIYIDAAWLNEYLNNYEVTGVNGILTVNPAEGALIWVGDGENGADFTYNGNANLPEAYYYDANGRKHELTVKLATYDEESGEYSVIDGEAVNAGSYFAVIVDANGNVIKADGNYTFENYGTAFKINKLEITVNVKDLQFTYGDVNLDELEAILGLGNGWTYGDNKPVDGDDLNIKLTIEGVYDGGNYLANGVYDLNVGWNEEDFKDNYSLKVVYEGDGELVVDKAEIIVDYDKKDDYVYDAYGVLGSTDGYVSDFVTNTKDFLELAGYQDAAVTAYFKLVDENDYAPDNDQYTGDIPEGLTEEGEYLFNFMIRVDNHATLYGRLLVKVSYAEYYLYVTVDGNKTLTETYGFETADDLAKTLLESGYANYDEDLNRVISKETFLEWVTAKVIDENGNEVSGRLPVGNYKVIFALNENADERYSIYKASTRTVAIEITKYVLDIDWGDESNLNYTYDGTVHMPVVKVEGITLDDSCKVSDGVYEITVNGEKVKVTLTVDGDFTAAGGHSVLVTVEGENFAIAEESALRSVSINEPANEVEVPGASSGVSLEDWKLWLIIAAAIVLAAIIIALVIILVKRRKSSDDDGFYDDVAESDL